MTCGKPVYSSENLKHSYTMDPNGLLDDLSMLSLIQRDAFERRRERLEPELGQTAITPNDPTSEQGEQL